MGHAFRVSLVGLVVACSGQARRELVVRNQAPCRTALVTMASLGPDAWCVDPGAEAGQRWSCADVRASSSELLDALTRDLAGSGYVVQVASHIPTGAQTGAFGLRFRKGDLFGDVAVDDHGGACNQIALRLQRPRRVVYPLTWSSRFELGTFLDGAADPSQYCDRTFPRSEQFPFADAAYARGCVGAHWQ